MIKSANLKDASVPAMEPPIVIMNDAVSHMECKLATPPLESTPNTNITTPNNIPTIDAISTFSTYHP